MWIWSAYLWLLSPLINADKLFCEISWILTLMAVFSRTLWEAITNFLGFPGTPWDLQGLPQIHIIMGFVIKPPHNHLVQYWKWWDPIASNDEGVGGWFKFNINWIWKFWINIVGDEGINFRKVLNAQTTNIALGRREYQQIKPKWDKLYFKPYISNATNKQAKNNRKKQTTKKTNQSNKTLQQVKCQKLSLLWCDSIS